MWKIKNKLKSFFKSDKVSKEPLSYTTFHEVFYVYYAFYINVHGEDIMFCKSVKDIETYKEAEKIAEELKDTIENFSGYYIWYVKKEDGVEGYNIPLFQYGEIVLKNFIQ